MRGRGETLRRRKKKGVAEKGTKEARIKGGALGSTLSSLVQQTKLQERFCLTQLSVALPFVPSIFNGAFSQGRFACVRAPQLDTFLPSALGTDRPVFTFFTALFPRPLETAFADLIVGLLFQFAAVCGGFVGKLSTV